MASAERNVASGPGANSQPQTAPTTNPVATTSDVSPSDVIAPLLNRTSGVVLRKGKSRPGQRGSGSNPKDAKSKYTQISSASKRLTPSVVKSGSTTALASINRSTVSTSIPSPRPGLTRSISTSAEMPVPGTSPDVARRLRLDAEPELVLNRLSEPDGEDGRACIIRTIGDVSELKYDALDAETAASAGLTAPTPQQLERWAYELSLQCLLFSAAESAQNAERSGSLGLESKSSAAPAAHCLLPAPASDATWQEVQRLQKAFNLHPHVEAEIRTRTTCLTPHEYVLRIVEIQQAQLDSHKFQFKEVDAFQSWKQKQLLRLEQVGSKLSRERDDVAARVRVDIVEGRGFISRKDVARRTGGLTGLLSNTTTTQDSSDPFVELQLGSQPPVRTQVEHNTTAPVWGESFVFDILSPDPHKPDDPALAQDLKITLWHQVTGWPDVKIGIIRIPLAGLKQKEYKEEWLIVRDPSDMVSLAELKIRIAYSPLRFDFNPAPLSPAPLYRILFRKLICLDGIEYVAAPADDALGLIPTSEVTQEGAIFSLAPLTHFSLQNESKRLLDSFADLYGVSQSVVDIVTLEMLLYYGESKKHLDTILSIMKTYVWEHFSLQKTQAAAFAELKNAIATEFMEKLITDCINCFDLSQLSSAEGKDSAVIRTFQSALATYRFLYPSSYLPRLQTALKDRIVNRYRKWKTSPSSSTRRNLTELGVLALMCDRMSEEVDSYSYFLADASITDDMKILSRDVAAVFAELLSVDLRRHFSYGAPTGPASLVQQQQLQLQHQIARPEAQQHAQEPQYRADAFDLCVKVADLCIQWHDCLPNVDEQLMTQVGIVPFICGLVNTWICETETTLQSWLSTHLLPDTPTTGFHAPIFAAIQAALDYQKPVLSSISIVTQPLTSKAFSSLSSPPVSPLSSPRGGTDGPTSPATSTSPGGRSSVVRAEKTPDSPTLVERLGQMAKKLTEPVITALQGSFSMLLAENHLSPDLEIPAAIISSFQEIDAAVLKMISLSEELIDLGETLGATARPPRIDTLHTDILNSIVDALSKFIVDKARTTIDGAFAQIASGAMASPTETDLDHLSAFLSSTLSKLQDVGVDVETSRLLIILLRRKLANLILELALMPVPDSPPRISLLNILPISLLGPLDIPETDAETEDSETATAQADRFLADEEIVNSVNIILHCLPKSTADVIDLYQTSDSSFLKEQLTKMLRVRSANDPIAAEFLSKQRRPSVDSKSRPAEVLDDLADAFRKHTGRVTDKVRNLFQ